MKLASRREPLRYWRAVLLVLMLVATTSSADASMYCLRTKELRPISDPLLKDRIEERLQAIPAMKSHQVGELTKGFALAWQVDEECRKSFRCHHLLLDTRSDAATIVFAYQGTGTIWVLASPLAEWSHLLDDDYAIKALETDDFNYVEVRLPQRRLGPVWIGAIPSDNGTLKACADRKYE